MAAKAPPTVSKSRVDRAGDILREYISTDPPVPDELFQKAVLAYRAAQEWRRSTAYPLALVTPGVRNWVDQESDQMIAAQRLKRMPQIVNKLNRFPTMRLSQMEDIPLRLPRGRQARHRLPSRALRRDPP